MFKPRYTLSDGVLNDIAQIERQTVQLRDAFIPSELKAHIQKQCQIALTHYSTQIEGNQLSLEQVSGVVEEKKSYGLLRDEKEVSNYFKLLQKIPALTKRYGGKLTRELVLHVHSEILSGIVSSELRGTIRNVQNAIYEARTNALVYLPPEVKDVPQLVDDLCAWSDGEGVHPIIMAALFHNQFVTIHPFLDGNGRAARFLTLYFLDTKGYEWRHLVPIDRYYADERQRYYAALQGDYPHNYYDGRVDADFTSWIEYYVGGIRAILGGTLNQLDLFSREQILMNNRQAKMLKILAGAGMTTAAEYAARFKISPRMASRDLRQLVEWGKLAVIGKGRATKYLVKK